MCVCVGGGEGSDLKDAVITTVTHEGIFGLSEGDASNT